MVLFGKCRTLSFLEVLCPTCCYQISSQEIRQFGTKEHLLGHLSSIPDTMWRSDAYVGKPAREANSPTHFVDLDYISMTPNVGTLPRTIKDALAETTRLCASPPKSYVCPAKDGDAPSMDSVGTAPWRIAQLMRETTASFREAKDQLAAGKKKEAWDAVNEAIKYAGLASHFVADMANPYHASRNYDGWETGQGGVHGYFESEIVSALPLDLDMEVFEHARTKAPRTDVLKLIPAKVASVYDHNLLDIAWALSVQSFSRYNAINDLDRKLAVTKLGRVEKGLQIKAERKPAATVAKEFRPLVVERLAIAADVLAFLWEQAWINAGKPDLSDFASWDYPLAPDFVPVNY